MNKKWVQKLIASRPDIKKKHGTPMTRRELFAQGYITTGAYVAMPSMLSIVAGVANGQDCRTVVAGPDAGIPVLIIDGAGGWGIPGRNVMVGGEGGQTDFLTAGSYGSLGIMPGSEPTQTGIQIQRLNNSSLAFNEQSYFYEGLSNPALLSDAAKELVNGRIYAVRSGDDQRNNPWNPAYWLRAAGADGSVVSIIGNDDANDWGANSVGPMNSYKSAYKPVGVRSPADAIGLVLPGILATAGGDKFVASIMNATKTMSEAEIKKFASLPADQQFQITCAYANANYQAQSFKQEDVDPEQDPDILAAFGDGTTLNQDGLTRTAATMTKLLLDGYAGVGSVRAGGRDYHNNMDWQIDDRELGEITARVIEAAHLKGKPIMIIHYTDGGVSANTDGSQANNQNGNPASDPVAPGDGQFDRPRGLFGPTNDSGTRSSTFSMVYNPSAIPEVDSHQAGAFNSSGAVDTVAPFSDSPAIASELMVLDYLRLQHEPQAALEKFNEITGSANGAALQYYAGYKKLT